MNTTFREKLKNKKRIVIKIGSSSLTHPDTGYLDLIKLEVLVREISDLRNQVMTENHRAWHKSRHVQPSGRQSS